MNTLIENLKSELSTIKEKYDEIQILNNIDVSAYTLSKKETDENPNEAAWGKPIVGKTCAVSRDLSYLKHKFIKIDGFDTVLFVNDTMNSRFKNSVDVLVKDKKMANSVGRSERRIIVLGS
jgi:peroxiredoxin